MDRDGGGLPRELSRKGEALNRQAIKRALPAFIALMLALPGNAARAAEEPGRISVAAMAAGALSGTDLGLAMIEARARVTKNLFVTAAPTLLLVEGGGHEYQFRTAATLLLRAGPIQLDDRNLWVFSDAGTTRYRNRLRLTAPVSVGEQVLRLQLFDEVYYQESGPGWFRNVIAGGVGVDVNRSFSADAYWMLFNDDNRTQTSMFLMLFTMRLR